MKRLLILLLSGMLSLLPLMARDQSVRDVDISMTVFANGNIVFHERWDVDTGDRITEWYLVRENLGDIAISKFAVYDGDNDRLNDDGEWNVNRTREEKAGKFGMVHKTNGVELCWGIGDYGNHVYNVLYLMERAVKSLNDYDMLHLQVVSPGLASPPEHVRVKVKFDSMQIDTTNTRIWGFGFVGTSAFEDESTVVYESTEPFGTEDSVILLMRFDKGMFFSPSVQERDFEDVLQKAMEGAEWGEDGTTEDNSAEGMALLLTMVVIYFIFIHPIVRAIRKKKNQPAPRKLIPLGFLPKNAPVSRDIPMKGDLRMADFVLYNTGNDTSSGGLPLAIILRLLYSGYLNINRELEGPAVISFNEQDLSALDATGKDLIYMLKSAAGEDKKLQEKEFRSWALAHPVTVESWIKAARAEGSKSMAQEGWYLSGSMKLTDPGQEETQRLFGFKNFLASSTLVDRREAFETHLWKEYMVYGAMFGLTDHVAKQLKDIDPALFRETFRCAPDDFSHILSTGSSFAHSIYMAGQLSRTRPTYSSSYSSSSYSSSSSYRSSHGYGGHTSRRGGGGYSGGGRGGGGR